MYSEVNQLVTAVRSPVAPVVHDDRPVAGDLCGQVYFVAIEIGRHERR